MALNIPRAGLTRFLKDGTRHMKGVEESVLRNIEACTELAANLRSAYGPNGMNKMVINHLEKLFVTNDAATILKELDIQHPAAKLMVMASEMQEHEVGDGTNLVIIFAGALLEHAEELIRMGLSPTEIADGYDHACTEALKILPNLVCSQVDNLGEKEAVVKALRPAVMSKQYGHEDLLADLVADACLTTLPKNQLSFNVDNVRVCKILGSSVMGSTVMHGMVFKRSAEGDVKHVDNAKVACFTCPFDVLQTETKGNILIQTAEELLNFSAGEEELVEKQVKLLADAGVNVVVSGGKFGDLHIHYLNKYGIMGVRMTSKFDLRRLVRTVGATALPRLTTPAPDELGSCSRVDLEEIGDVNVISFKQESEHGRIATIVIRGSTQNLMDDIERAVDDAINVFKALAKDSRLVPGAGAIEIELARHVEKIGSACPGLEQYAIQKFAQALESLLKVLADNCGVKATEILSKVYAAHQDGNANIGLDIEAEGGGVMDSVKAGIVDAYITKHQALKLATNAAATILRVDQIIMSKPAGGPKVAPPGKQDEDDTMA